MRGEAVAGEVMGARVTRTRRYSRTLLHVAFLAREKHRQTCGGTGGALTLLFDAAPVALALVALCCSAFAAFWKMRSTCVSLGVRVSEGVAVLTFS